MTDDQARTREAVINRYSGLAQLAQAGGTPVDCDGDAFSSGCFGATAYDQADAPEAALRASLGCGNPLAVADLREGERVLDLGSGGGLDVLLSARRVGPAGKAYGLDASEDIPLPDVAVDVVISNCVINLSLDKARVLAEAFRVLRPGGRLGITDVIASDGLDPAQRAAAEQRAGCSNGTLAAADYQHLLLAAGFTNPSIKPTTDAGGGLCSAVVQATKPAA